VQEFNDLFARVYELDRENSNLTENGVKSLKDYQNMLLTDTDFDHKKEQPLLEALSGLVDCLIILPQFFKAAIGYDPITDEDLTDQECQDLVIDGCFQTVLLGASAGTGLVASAAEKAAAKAAAIEAGAIAGDEVLIKGEAVIGEKVAGEAVIGDTVTGEAITGEAVAGDEILISGEGAAAEDINAYHVVDEEWKVQSVLDGIDISYTSPDCRFGQGFYVSTEGNTATAELAYHGNEGKFAIRYEMDLSGQNILALTNPDIATEWGYAQQQSTLLDCQSIADKALTEGYNVIKVQSYRADGINYIIYDNFDDILTPKMVMPIGGN
jgi:hypothetical protein